MLPPTVPVLGLAVPKLDIKTELPDVGPIGTDEFEMGYGGDVDRPSVADVLIPPVVEVTPVSIPDVLDAVGPEVAFFNE